MAARRLLEESIGGSANGACDDNAYHSRTGRRRSRNHHTAWLVNAGDGPNTNIGSQRTKHSHIDQRLDRHDSNITNGGGNKGGEEASI
jgi:hypothetical protein